MPLGQRDYASQAFTLMEVVVVIAIVLVVAALLVPAIGSVRTRAANAQARQLVQSVHAALQLYRDEDALRRFPAMAADCTIRLGGLADLLAVRGLRVGGETALEIDGGRPALVDPWDQPVLYHLDDHTSGDGVARRPRDAAGDEVRVPGDVTDWNPPRGQPARATVPYAYVWSWGRPHEGHQLRGNAAAWIYVALAPGQP